MRKFILLPAILLTTSLAYAGESDNSGASTTAAPSVGGLFPHFNPTGGASGIGKPITENLRLVAKTYSLFNDGGFLVVDSTRYGYGSGRGSLPNPEDINNDEHVLFDMSTKYEFNTTSWSYHNKELREQYYNGNRVTQLVYKNWHVTSGTWRNNERYVYTYDQSGKMAYSTLEQWYGQMWTQSTNSTLTYDANKNVVNMSAPLYKVDFSYDGSNNLTQIVDYVRTLNSPWTLSERKTYTYAGADVNSYVLEKWIDNTWVKTNRWEYTLDAQGNVTKEVEYTWNGVAWTPSVQQEYVYDNNKNKLEEVSYSWDANSGSFVKGKREARKYNEKSLLVNVTTYNWKNQAWVHSSGDINVNFYYEQYNPSAIPTLPNAAELAVYPVPAKDNINIALDWDVPATFTMVIADMSGRIVYRTEEQAVSKYRSTIPVAHLPAGNYALMVNGGDVNIAKKLVIAD